MHTIFPLKNTSTLCKNLPFTDSVSQDASSCNQVSQMPLLEAEAGSTETVQEVISAPQKFASPALKAKEVRYKEKKKNRVWGRVNSKPGKWVM